MILVSKKGITMISCKHNGSCNLNYLSHLVIPLCMKYFDCYNIIWNKSETLIHQSLDMIFWKKEKQLLLIFLAYNFLLLWQMSQDNKKVYFLS